MNDDPKRRARKSAQLAEDVLAPCYQLSDREEPRFDGERVSLPAQVADAVRALTAQAFDVAVSDIAMPEQDGFDFLRAVRRHSPELPVIALTAFASDRDRQRVLAAGFQGFLSKPVEAMRLYDALRRAVRQARRRQSARA